MEHGIVTDWDAMELLWRYAIVLLVQRPEGPSGSRTRTAELMFEAPSMPSLMVLQ